MTILKPKRGDEVLISNCLRLIVLEINDCRVKLGVCDTMLSQTGGVLSEPLAEICRNKSCYFWFPKNGCCMLVMTCTKGKAISLTGSGCVTVLDIAAEKVTLAVTGMPLFGAYGSNARHNDRRKNARARGVNARTTHQFKSGANLAQPLHISPARFWRHTSWRR